MKTLYERLGGREAIGQAVDRFYERVLADEDLKPFFARTNMAVQRVQQTAFLSQALGGPEVYRGRSMRGAHRALPIEARHFDRVVEHLGATLTSMGVPPALVGEVAALLVPLKAEIVGG